jgi:hypothetical protein
MPAYLCLQIQQLIEKIFAVPDGIGGNRRPNKVSREMGYILAGQQ